MREIIFDTETTGLDAKEDRIIEIGAVELVNRFPTGNTFHVFINPQGRQVHPEALAVHGISNERLANEPTFPEIVDRFLDFFDGAKMIAHNANFDMGFINAELARLGQPALDPDRVVDSLALARRKHPMGPNSLDALCRRYGINNSHRTFHGALLDSQLLAEVYIELIGGRQAALILDAGNERGAVEASGGVQVEIAIAPRPEPLPSRISEAERVAHAKLVAGLGEKAIWAKILASQSGEADTAEQLQA
ncbi:DNA polymerase-3 subunit epsilon [Mesorhizobium soli]|uniref:DNA polymerase III subunit epsilon n=1 Tax=Pseudaminobacter soli (ex Li et al. 2025) TaxID=1295366 RepID=UPI00247653C6|nr:DNA polymerase III subunit epsilon [Mesorhizobium soli]MDH6231342.1 DNA polymerase-3 subunit epsilon [Mesorhizobium soli]